MNLFKRKAHTVIMCNLMVPFVCTGFLGTKNATGIITGNTTDEAHEISLTASDTEPVSQYGEGEEERYAFIFESIKAIINQQEDASLQIEDIDDETFAFIIEGIESIIGMQDGELSLDQLEENEYAFVAQSIGAIMEQHEEFLEKEGNKAQSTIAKKATNTKKTTSVVTKKEVTKSVSYAKPSTSNASGDAIASYAKKFLGLPYKHYYQGSSLQYGTDCSGFTMLIYKEFGISIPRTVGGQLGRGSSVSKSNLQKGDLVFFKPKGCKSCGASHVSIYIGGGQVIHETRPGRGVAITGIDGLSNIQFYAARRIINSSNQKVVEKKVEEKNKADNTTATINNTTTNDVVTNIDEKKDENINNNVVVENNNNITTTTTETSTEVKQDENKTDISKEETVVETPKAEETPKVEVETSKTEEKTPVEETKKEESKEEVKETKVSSAESN